MKLLTEYKLQSTYLQRKFSRPLFVELLFSYNPSQFCGDFLTKWIQTSMYQNRLTVNGSPDKEVLLFWDQLTISYVWSWMCRFQLVKSTRKFNIPDHKLMITSKYYERVTWNIFPPQLKKKKCACTSLSP